MTKQAFTPMVKPVVSYRTAAFHFWDPEDPHSEYAMLTGVRNHPVLGDPAWCRTSLIMSKFLDPDGKLTGFETLNTQYRLDNLHF